jgi:hypothetical protein
VHKDLTLVSRGQTAISINGDIGNYFRNGRGVCQGDPYPLFSSTTLSKP